jgi:hypothetical protein
MADGVQPQPVPGIAWRNGGPDLVKRVIKYRERRVNTGWTQSIKTWAKAGWSSDYQTPTLTLNHNVPSGNDVAIVWRTDSHQLLSVKREAGCGARPLTSQTVLTHQ